MLLGEVRWRLWCIVSFGPRCSHPQVLLYHQVEVDTADLVRELRRDRFLMPYRGGLSRTHTCIGHGRHDKATIRQLEVVLFPLEFFVFLDVFQGEGHVLGHVFIDNATSDHLWVHLYAVFFARLHQLGHLLQLLTVRIFSPHDNLIRLLHLFLFFLLLSFLLSCYLGHQGVGLLSL